MIPLIVGIRFKKGMILTMDTPSTSRSIRKYLSEIVPFNSASSWELDRFAEAARELRHKKGEYIFSEGDEASSVWVLKSGRLDIYKYSTEGKPHAIETINPGDLFGTLCRLGGVGKNYPCTAYAATDSVSIQIPESIFRNIFNNNPALVSGVCALCSQRLNQLQDLSCVAQDSVEKRIARTLLDLAKKNGPKLEITKREVAEISGTTVETAIRTMSRFEKNKWISSTRGHLIVAQPSRLSALLE